MSFGDAEPVTPSAAAIRASSGVDCLPLPLSDSFHSPPSVSASDSYSCIPSTSTQLLPNQQEKNFLDDLFEGLDAPCKQNATSSFGTASATPSELSETDTLIRDRDETSSTKSFYFENRSDDEALKLIVEQFEREEEEEKNGESETDRLLKELWATRPKKQRKSGFGVQKNGWRKTGEVNKRQRSKRGRAK